MTIRFYGITFKESKRKDLFLSRVQKNKLKCELIEGVSKYSTMCILRHRATVKSNDGAYGIIGCFLSHLLAIKRGYDSGDPYFGVLEDDVLFIDDFQSRLETVMKNLEEGWKLLMLCTYQSTWDGCWWAGKDKSIQNLALINSSSFGTQGYIMTRDAAEHVLFKFSRYISVPIDKLTNDDLNEIIQKDLTSEAFTMEFVGNGGYMSCPFLIIESSEDTNIQSNEQLAKMKIYFEGNKKGNRYS